MVQKPTSYPYPLALVVEPKSRTWDPAKCTLRGHNSPKPKVIQAEVADIDRPPITGNISAQSLNLLKLNWAVTVESNSKSTSQSPKLFDARGKPHPFPLTKEYLLFAVFQAPHTI